MGSTDKKLAATHNGEGGIEGEESISTRLR